MASFRIPSSLLVSLAATIFCLLVAFPEETEGKSCVFHCMREVISCKRKLALKPGGNGECCKKYYECFLECKPDATKFPPCQSGAGKRSMWLQEDVTEPEDSRLPSFSDFF
ncbi:uncharacterized protein LOC143291106 [Babylonia areolata]|uniref:uncharacterized protein LOC143291106 n=1 Tax=Babylonia areolata TaxID=304850 RepID=UPI003FD4B8AB